MSEIDIKVDKKGVVGEILIPLWEPKKRIKIEASGKASTDFEGKRRTWGAGIKIRF